MIWVFFGVIGVMLKLSVDAWVVINIFVWIAVTSGWVW